MFSGYFEIESSRKSFNREYTHSLIRVVYILNTYCTYVLSFLHIVCTFK